MKRAFACWLAACFAPAFAQDAAPPPPAASFATPTEVVEAFHDALEESYQQGVVDQLAPGLIVYEQGYAELSRDAYAGGHLYDDMLFGSSTKRTIVRREAWESDDTAWVITQSITEGQFAERTIALENTETMILRRDAQGWKIVHIHWSGHPRPQAPAIPAPPTAPATPGPQAAPAPAPEPAPAPPVAAPADTPAEPAAPEAPPLAPAPEPLPAADQIKE